MDQVIFTKVDRQLKKLPQFIVIKLLAWAKSDELNGLQEKKKISGYHDEPLKGHRQDQRSIRLSKSYRAIYVEETNGTVNLVNIEEVNMHEY